MDQKFIKKTFELALLAKGLVSPNPLVGAVIVKNDKIISTGYHQGPGCHHAEIEAINNAQESLHGATLYCNLEPCCHTNKRTPPCVPRIVEAGISRVVISNFDSNPEVSGLGVKQLKDAGIEVYTDVLNEEGFQLNEHFFYHITNKRPFVHLKWAQSLNGKISNHDSQSPWITSEQSREQVHLERLSYDAILVGNKTAHIDNPKLTIRKEHQVLKCPKRIILSETGMINPLLNVFSDEFRSQTILVSPVRPINLPLECQHINWDQDPDHLLKTLYQKGITSIYVEGGAQTIEFFIKNKIYNKISIYQSNKNIDDGITISHPFNIEEFQLQNIGAEHLYTKSF
jgi:diaminohydroxyphosphoribosylaminopyrimidine deaminase/5-amino-6-(5-phosphoribosylamino)uracil reductase